MAKVNNFGLAPNRFDLSTGEKCKSIHSLFCVGSIEVDSIKSKNGKHLNYSNFK